MKIKTKVIIAGVATAAVATAVGVTLAVRAIKRRAKRVLSKKMRSLLTEVVQMRSEDFVPGGDLGKSLFRHKLEGLDDRQLVALAALVQVGYFIKVSEIDPLHPSKDEIKRAVDKYLVEERLAAKDRGELLANLDSTDVHDALVAAFKVLTQE